MARVVSVLVLHLRTSRMGDSVTASLAADPELQLTLEQVAVRECEN